MSFLYSLWLSWDCTSKWVMTASSCSSIVIILNPFTNQFYPILGPHGKWNEYFNVQVYLNSLLDATFQIFRKIVILPLILMLFH